MVHGHEHEVVVGVGVVVEVAVIIGLGHSLLISLLHGVVSVGDGCFSMHVNSFPLVCRFSSNELPVASSWMPLPPAPL